MNDTEWYDVNEIQAIAAELELLADAYTEPKVKDNVIRAIAERLKRIGDTYGKD